MMNKKTASLLCTAAMLVSAATGCTAEAAPASEPASAAQTAAAAAASTKIPKYVFLFIGDGMSYPQIQLTNYYLSAAQNETSPKP